MKHKLNRTQLLKKAHALGLFILEGSSNKRIDSMINFREADILLAKKIFKGEKKMNVCDPGITEIILGFSVGGATLRVAIAYLKKKLGWKGFPAHLLTFGCCAGSVVIYMSVVNQWTWDCFMLWTGLVFVGTQTAYRLSHKKKKILP